VVEEDVFFLIGWLCGFHLFIFYFFVSVLRCICKNLLFAFFFFCLGGVSSRACFAMRWMELFVLVSCFYFFLFCSFMVSFCAGDLFLFFFCFFLELANDRL
jgi:hypothetical protein